MSQHSPTPLRWQTRRAWLCALIALLVALCVTVLAQKRQAPAAATSADRPIIQNIQKKLSDNEELAQHLEHISVTSNKGVVTLVGVLETDEQIEAAVEAARETKGVKDVINKLKREGSSICGSGQQSCAGSCIDEADPCNPSKRG